MTELEVERLLADLSGDAWSRHRAADLLRDAPQTREVLTALVEALGDPTYYETPGDYDAPPFYYDVASKAAESLCKGGVQVVDLIVQRMRGSELAAQHAPKVLAHCGAAGVDPFLELLKHPSVAVRNRAVNQATDFWSRLHPELRARLLTGLLEALLDPAAEVTYSAVSTLRYFAQANPQVSLSAHASAWLVPALVDRMLQSPTAGTYFEAAGLLRDQPRIWTCWVELAVQGNHHAALLVLDQLDRLSAADVQRLVQAPDKPYELILILGGLRERAVGAVEQLVPLLDDPAKTAVVALALVRIPGGASAAQPHLAKIFVQEKRTRKSIYDWHPDTADLAQQVLPGLRLKLNNADPRDATDALDAMAVLGTLAAGELPAVLPLLRPFTAESYVRHSALTFIETLGPAAAPALDALARLLDVHSLRPEAVATIAKLGAVAAELSPLLEVLQLENPQDDKLTAALQAVKTET